MESRREELVVVQVRKVVVVSMAVAGVKTASTGEIRGRYGGDMRQMRQAIPSPSLPRPPAAAGCWLSSGSLTRAPETPEGYMTLCEGYMTGGVEGYMTLGVSARGQMRQAIPSPSLPRPPAAAGCWLSSGSLTRAPETPEGYMTLDEGYMTHPRGGDEGYMTLEVSARGACKNSQRTPPQRGP